MKVYTFTGCMAVGKTTLARYFSKAMNFKLVSEECDDNPYLNNYYKNMSEFAFKMQRWYLNNRISQLLKIRKESAIVQDQMLQAFGYVFPSIQNKNGYMSDSDFGSIMNVMNTFYDRSWEAFPNGMNEIMFYLRVAEDDAPKIEKRIKRIRGRDYESNIPIEYITSLIREYEEWYNRSMKIDTRIVTLDAFAPIEGNLSKALESVL